MKKVAVISLSGGMDSTCLLLHLISSHYSVYAYSFNYGQKHKLELNRLKKNIKFIKENINCELSHQIINLSSLSSVLTSALTTESIPVPEGNYQEENMKQTVVPNRNAIFSSILFGAALSLANKHNSDVALSLGVHSGDHAIYPDCRLDFYLSALNTFRIGNWDGDKVEFYIPYINYNKADILVDLVKSIEVIYKQDPIILKNASKLSTGTLQYRLFTKYTEEQFFTKILENTNTCYNPSPSGEACGVCGSCTERLEAFHTINKIDPVKYKK